MRHSSKSSPPSNARLFADSHADAAPAGVHIADIDGASRGNPGPAAYALVLRGPNGDKISELSKYIGRETNNAAEYYALIAALDYAAAHQIRALRVRSDSELIVRQMQGRYKVKNAELKSLHERAQKLSRALDYFVIEHVAREMNSEADALANLALDRTGSVSYRERMNAKMSKQGSNETSESGRVTARFSGGVFIPGEEVRLPEGATVELKFRISK
ncbi:MAG TPA: ribonuclease HI family protein [Candidatus Acidoferrales bacterium]|nr:ribonuclease HI family protein [Candidatus Acidoferrales bacterium]